MSKKHVTPEEIIGKLRHADVLLGQGKEIAEVVKSLGVTGVTYYHWRQEFGGMTTAHAWSLKHVVQAVSGEAAFQQRRSRVRQNLKSGRTSHQRPLGCLHPYGPGRLFTTQKGLRNS